MILLAKQFDPKKDYSGWFLSEKLDGYRAIWDGFSQQMKSRQGNIFNIPNEVKKKLPKNIILDGELFISRNKFEQCSILKKKNISLEEFSKSKMKYHVFDIIYFPKIKCKDKIQEIKNICSTSPFLIFVKQIKVKNNQHIQKLFEEFIKKGAEGIMLRDPESFSHYVLKSTLAKAEAVKQKRSNSLVKLKDQDDDEAIIIGYNISTSKKYNGLLKSFQCILKKNKKITFQVSGFSEEIRKNFKNTHPINTIITFSHNGFTSKNIPRHPRYKRIFCLY